jgi:hypothetical protein
MVGGTHPENGALMPTPHRLSDDYPRLLAARLSDLWGAYGTLTVESLTEPGPIIIEEDGKGVAVCVRMRAVSDRPSVGDELDITVAMRRLCLRARVLWVKGDRVGVRFLTRLDASLRQAIGLAP